MGRINSRSKGRSGEQEVARLLRDQLGLEIHRNWVQQASNEGGADIVGVPSWSLEVKRAKAYSNKWFEQATNQAIDATKAQSEFERINPVLLYRLDRQQWKAELLARDVIPELADNYELRVTMPVEGWIEIVRERM